MTTPPAGVPTCYRHPGTETYISCQRCGRSICPQCMTEASVGFHCPECVAEGRRSVRQPRTAYGGKRTDNPVITTYALIAANIGVFLALLGTGGRTGELARALLLTPRGVCEAGGTSIYPGIPNATQCAMAPQATGWADGVAGGAWWQLITSGFAHLEIWHIAFNMLALLFLGPQLERVTGRVRFVAIYLLSILAGSAAVMWLAEPYSSTLGASGGVFGLIGALLVVTLRMGGDARPLTLWLGLNVAITVFGASYISWQGHLGGLLGGVAATAIVVLAPRARRGLIQALGLGAMTLFLLALVVLRVAELT